MSNSNESNILDDKIALVSIAVGTFAGYRRLTRAMIADLGGSLPASAAVTEGSIKVFPNEPLKPSYTRRRKAFRLVAEKAIKALGSHTVFAFPKADLAEIEKILVEAEAEHVKDVAALDSNYESVFGAHVDANPLAANIIKGLKVPKAEAIAKMRFAHNFFSISPAVRDGANGATGVENIVVGLTRQLYEEVADAMADLSKSDSLTGKIKAGQRTLRPIKAQIAKMKGLSFLDPSIDAAVQFISGALATMPAEGYIEDGPVSRHFSTLQRLVEKLADADDIVDAAGKTANGIKPDAILFPAKKEAPVQAALPMSSVAAPPAPPKPTAAGSARVPAARTPAPAVSRMPAAAIRPAGGATRPMFI